MEIKRRARSSATIDPADAALFREAIGEVARLDHNLADVRPAPPPPNAAKTRADEHAAMAEIMRKPLGELALDLAEPLSYAREGVNKRLLRQLGRGQFSIRAELDLHRMTGAQAQIEIARFLDEQRDSGRLCVRIIHGKGLNSKNAEPVLKGVTDRALRHRGDVLAFRSARAADGGTGAVIVLLRPRR